MKAGVSVLLVSLCAARAVLASDWEASWMCAW